MRQLLGYDRLENPGLCKAINRLYVKFWEALHNYFCPSAKLLQKERHGAKVSRHHDTPTTPCDRLLASADVNEAPKEKLRQERASLNPFELARNIEPELRRILSGSPPFQSPFGLLALRGD